MRGEIAKGTHKALPEGILTDEINERIMRNSRINSGGILGRISGKILGKTPIKSQEESMKESRRESLTQTRESLGTP